MAPAYKLVYFNGRGAAESARYILKYGGIDFEDVRIEHASWPQVKSDTPFGQLPYLEHNGKRVAQSVAISRFAAKLAKLTGNNDWEDLEINAIVDTLTDLKNKLTPLRAEEDPDKKKKLLETAVNETFPFYLGKLDALAKQNNGYLAVGRLTWADLHFVSSVDALERFLGANLLGKCPNLQALVEKVNNLPAIKQWRETRPKTEF